MRKVPRIKRRRRSHLQTLLDDILTGSSDGACRRFVRHAKKFRRPLAGQLRRVKGLRDTATGEAHFKAIDKLVSMIERNRALAAEEAKRLARLRPVHRELKRGTVQERAEKALQLLHDSPLGRAP